YLEALGCQNIALLPVSIAEQGDESGTIRIIFNGLHGCRYIMLVALEIDNSVHSLVTSTDIAHRASSLSIAASGSRKRSQKTLLGLIGSQLCIGVTNSPTGSRR